MKRIAITLVAITGFLIAVVVSSASATNAHPSSGTGAVLTIEATPRLSYDQQEYRVRAGAVEVHLIGVRGITLRFADRRFRRCLLVSHGTPNVCRVNLAPGTYHVYDAIPSHRAAGVQATIVATP